MDAVEELTFAETHARQDRVDPSHLQPQQTHPIQGHLLDWCFHRVPAGPLLSFTVVSYAPALLLSFPSYPPCSHGSEAPPRRMPSLTSSKTKGDATRDRKQERRKGKESLLRAGESDMIHRSRFIWNLAAQRFGGKVSNPL